MRIAAACFVAALAACAPRPLSDEQRYTQWLAALGHAAEVAAYSAYLRQHDLESVLPMQQLLRSARRWRRCGADEFAVPPKSDWSAMRATLALVYELDHAGLLRNPRVASAYRDEALNRCEGGSTRSRHRINNALDFDIEPPQNGTARLCAYWRKHGPTRGFGLGFYTDHQIHVDTSGFRTWGSDFTRRSSLCSPAQ
jgi:peptidase M15-like protein